MRVCGFGGSRGPPGLADPRFARGFWGDRRVLNPRHLEPQAPASPTGTNNRDVRDQKADADGPSSTLPPRFAAASDAVCNDPIEGADLARAIALATAVEAFVAPEVRPLARELVELLRAAQAALRGATVVDFAARRRGR